MLQNMEQRSTQNDIERQPEDAILFEDLLLSSVPESSSYHRPDAYNTIWHVAKFPEFPNTYSPHTSPSKNYAKQEVSHTIYCGSNSKNAQMQTRPMYNPSMLVVENPYVSITISPKRYRYEYYTPPSLQYNNTTSGQSSSPIITKPPQMMLGSRMHRPSEFVPTNKYDNENMQILLKAIEVMSQRDQYMNTINRKNTPTKCSCKECLAITSGIRRTPFKTNNIQKNRNILILKKKRLKLKTKIVKRKIGKKTRIV